MTEISLQLKEFKDSVVYYHWSDLDTDRLHILYNFKSCTKAFFFFGLFDVGPAKKTE